MATKKRTTVKRVPPLTKFQREFRKAVNKAYKAAIAKEKKNPTIPNPGKILTPGKWIKARAIRVHRGKLEILK